MTVIYRLSKTGTAENNMAENPNTPYGENMKIYEIIEVLKEVEKMHIRMSQKLRSC